MFADMNTETAKASSEESKKYASNQGYQTAIFEMNVQDDKSVQAMVDFVVKDFGRLDYAVNAAGASHTHSPHLSKPTHLVATNRLRRLTTGCTHPSQRPTSTILTV